MFFFHKIALFLPSFSLPSAEAHRHVLEEAKTRLLSRIAPPPAGGHSQPQSHQPPPTTDELLALLSASFPFIGIPALRDVPLACLGRLSSPAVPASFLQQLAAADDELFSELPATVRRAVWERDRQLLGKHAAPLAAAYAVEKATIARALCDIVAQHASLEKVAGHKHRNYTRLIYTN